MSGAQIAAEVAIALADAGAAVGGGAFSATLTRPTGSETPWDIPTTAVTTWAVTVIVTMYDRRHIDGEQIRAEDRRVLMSAVGPVPAVSDRLTVSGAVYQVMAVNELAPAGVALMYELQCRR